MINPKTFLEFLKQSDINFFCGVPDSLLKEFCFCVNESVDTKSHIITSNEGASVALAAGFHLATKAVPLVYMQNSGLGNAINPLVSLCDIDVYKIPMILMIGWRGEPNIKDEPQHIKQGKIQLEQLRLLDIPFITIDNKTNDFGDITSLIKKSQNESRPVAIVVKKNTFDTFEAKSTPKEEKTLMKREKVLQYILESKIKNEIFITTTGKTSREFYEIRKQKSPLLQKDFLTVGSMGHSSQIALGIAMQKEQDVYCIDGDGSIIMHMGSLAINGISGVKNFKHIVLNNGSHESVGGQPTVGKEIDLALIAKSCGYVSTRKVTKLEELGSSIEWIHKNEGPLFLEIFIQNGSRSDLGRPKESPVENKLLFMKQLNDE